MGEIPQAYEPGRKVTKAGSAHMNKCNNTVEADAKYGIFGGFHPDAAERWRVSERSCDANGKDWDETKAMLTLTLTSKATVQFLLTLTLTRTLSRPVAPRMVISSWTLLNAWAWQRTTSTRPTML